MSEVKQLDLSTGDVVVYLPTGTRYIVEHVQASAKGIPEYETIFWLAKSGRVPKSETGLISIPKTLSGHYLRKIQSAEF